MMKNKPDFVRNTVWTCTRSMALGLAVVVLIVGAIVGLIRVGPTLASMANVVWTCWSLWITDNDTTMMPAVLLAWGSLLVTLWSVCIDVKLHRRARSFDAGSTLWANFSSSVPNVAGAIRRFRTLTVLMLTLGFLPSITVLMVFLGPLSWDYIAQQGVWSMVGAVTVGLCLGAIVLAMLCMFLMFFGSLITDHDGY